MCSNVILADNLTRVAKTYAVTGTYHGSIISAYSEGDARRAFHNVYNGESILSVKLLTYPLWFY